MSIRIFLSRHHRLSALVLYLVVLIPFVLPVLLHFTTHIPGSHDNFETYAGPFAWAKIVTDLDWRGTLDFLLPEIFNFRLYIFLLQYIVGEPLAFNIIWLSSFPLAAMGGYILAYHMTRHKLGSFFAGFVYGFAPLHFSYGMAFGSLLHIEFIPFFVLFLLRYLFQLRLRDFFLALLLFILILVNEPHYAAYAVLLIFILLGYFGYTKALYKEKKFLLHGAAVSLVGVLVVVWRYSSLLRISVSDQNYLSLGIDELIYFSTDLLAFLTPTYKHPLFGDWLSGTIMKSFSGNAVEWSAYIGFASLGIAIYALYKRWKQHTVRLWAFVFVFFLIMALGPFLRVGGLVEPMIPLPYLLIYKYVPFFENIRAVGRAFIIGYLALSVLVAHGVAAFIEAKGRYRTVMLWFALIFFEFLFVPQISSVAVPSFYEDLSNDLASYRILEPRIAASHGIASKMQYYEKIHGKEVVGRYKFSRENTYGLNKTKVVPVVNNLLYALPNGAPTTSFIRQDYARIGNFIMQQYDVRYITMSKEFVGIDTTQENFQKTRDFVEENITSTLVDDSDAMVVYRVADEPAEPPVLLYEDEGWGSTRQLPTGEFVGGLARQGAAIMVDNYKQQSVSIRLAIVVRSFKEDRFLRIIYNNEELAVLPLSLWNQLVVTYLEDVPVGNGKLVFALENHEGEEVFLSDGDNIAISLQYDEGVDAYRGDAWQYIRSKNGVAKTLSLPNSLRYIGQDTGDVLTGEDVAQSDYCSGLYFDSIPRQAVMLDETRRANIDVLQDKAKQCVQDLEMRYIVLHKTFFGEAELEVFKSYLALLLPQRIMLIDDEDVLIYDLHHTQDAVASWRESFENGFTNELIRTGLLDSVTISEDAHTAKYAAALVFDKFQNFNGLIKSFDAPAREANVEAWVRASDWSEDYADVYFDFIYANGAQSYVQPRQTFGEYEYSMNSERTLQIYGPGNRLATGHSLPQDEWVKIRLSIDDRGTLRYFENNKEVFVQEGYGAMPVHGFKIGVAGCCENSSIRLLVDDIAATVVFAEERVVTDVQEVAVFEQLAEEMLWSDDNAAILVLPSGNLYKKTTEGDWRHETTLSCGQEMVRVRALDDGRGTRRFAKKIEECMDYFAVDTIIYHDGTLSDRYATMRDLLLLFPHGKTVFNGELFSAYRLRDEPTAYQEWSSSFEDGFASWDIRLGEPDAITVVTEAHRGDTAAQITFTKYQRFNGLIKNFFTPAARATVEAWVKVEDWAQGFTDIYFDFIYDDGWQSYLEPLHTFGQVEYLLSDERFAQVRSPEGEQKKEHSLPIGVWIPIRITIDEDGTLRYFENDQEIFSQAGYGKTPVHGFKIGVGGCCDSSHIRLLVDDVRYELGNGEEGDGRE